MCPTTSYKHCFRVYNTSWDDGASVNGEEIALLLISCLPVRKNVSYCKIDAFDAVSCDASCPNPLEMDANCTVLARTPWTSLSPNLPATMTLSAAIL
jgi:hypothetical protein